MQTKWESGLRPAHLASGPTAAGVCAGSTSAPCGRMPVPAGPAAVDELPVVAVAPVLGPGTVSALKPGAAAPVAPGAAAGTTAAAPPAAGAWPAPETAPVAPLLEAGGFVPPRGTTRVEAVCAGCTADSGVVRAQGAGAMAVAADVCTAAAVPAASDGLTVESTPADVAVDTAAPAATVDSPDTAAADEAAE